MPPQHQPQHNFKNELYDANSWAKYERLVLAELERLDKSIVKNAEKYEQSLEDVRQAVGELRIEMLNGLSQLKTTVETHHVNKYIELETRVRESEKSISSMYGYSAGISFAIGLVVSIVGVVITYLSK